MRDCSEMPNYFENLAASGFDVINDCISDRTEDRPVHYNCIAWAIGDDSRWWWPWDIGGYHWPDELPTEKPGTETLGNLIDAFKIEGYVECADGEVEEGCEKVALFA